MSKPTLFKILGAFLLGLLLTCGPAGAAQGSGPWLAGTGEAILEGAEKIYKDLESGSKPSAALAELFSFLKDKVRQFNERMERDLWRPDLGPAEKKALEAARVFLAHLEKLLNILERLIQGDHSPELKRAYREVRGKALKSLEKLKNSEQIDCLET